MIPSHNIPKYKILVRLRTDIWNTLRTKALKKKKWRILRSLLKGKRLFGKKRKRQPRILNYEVKALPKFPVYARYRYQRKLNTRQTIKLIYGSLQDYKIKSLALIGKTEAWRGFTKKLEQKAIVFLYRSKLTFTLGEAKIHFRHKRILVNNSCKIPYIEKGDVLHFTPIFEKLLKRRIYSTFSKYSKSRKRKKKIKFTNHNCVDFDPSSFRFYFIDNIKYYKTHPFYIHFERVWRWYTRV